MGITGLLPLLKSIHHQRHLREFAGKTLGVDTYGWLHKATIPCAIELAQGKPTTKYVDYILHRVRMLQYFGVTPYLVFDGDYLPSKASTELEREQRRAAAKAAGLELLRLGKTTDAHKELQKAVDVSPMMARIVMDACRKMGVKCIVAPYEADAQLYYLEKIGEIDGVISEDSDMLVYGVKRLITKLDQYGECVEINREQFTACRDVSLAGWSDQEFRMMCILSGCDYLDSINGIGLKKAYGLVKRHSGDVGKIVRSVKFDGTKKVPEGYEEAFRRAEVTFRHQRVFCPKENRLVFCNEPDAPLNDEHLIHIGPDLDEDIAQGVARGELDPMTKAPLQPNHAAVNTKSDFKSFASETPRSSNNKSITSFFKPKSAPKLAISRGPDSTPRTPLQPRSSNISAPRPVFSAPSAALSTSAVKRPFASVGPSNKRPRVEDIDDDLENGEQSKFFKNKSRRTRINPAIQTFSTPSRKTQQRELHQLEAESTPTPQAYTTFTSQTTASSDVGSMEKVAQGWKSKYGFGGSSNQSSAKLSDIIKKQNAFSQASITTPLQRLSAFSTPRTTTTSTFKTSSRTSTMPRTIKKSFDIGSFISDDKENEHDAQPLSPTIRPLTGSLGNDTESSQEEWPEFVGVDKFNRSAASSQSVGQQSDVRGIFSKYAFQG